MTPLPENQVVELADSTITSSNTLASLSLSTVRVQPGRLTLAISILSLVRDYPIRLQSISAQIFAKHGFYVLVTEPFPEDQMLQPHSPYQAMRDFVVDQRLPANNPAEAPRLDLQAVIGFGEHVAVLRLSGN